MIARFVSGEDTSIELANEIEAAIDDAFEHDDFMQETVEMLAMYRPGGGEFLFDVPEMRQRLIETEARLRAK
ncbi:MAG: hypothetical protein K2P70_09620 [Hyphomonadaceae bacterium]|nr:hypothetical protein [Hyphomonadaceae bacterium]